MQMILKALQLPVETNISKINNSMVKDVDKIKVKEMI